MHLKGRLERRVQPVQVAQRPEFSGGLVLFSSTWLGGCDLFGGALQQQVPPRLLLDVGAVGWDEGPGWGFSGWYPGWRGSGHPWKVGWRGWARS